MFSLVSSFSMFPFFLHVHFLKKGTRFSFAIHLQSHFLKRKGHLLCHYSFYFCHYSFRQETRKSLDRCVGLSCLQRVWDSMKFYAFMFPKKKSGTYVEIHGFSPIFKHQTATETAVFTVAPGWPPEIWGFASPIRGTTRRRNWMRKKPSFGLGLASDGKSVSAMPRWPKYWCVNRNGCVLGIP